jgi:hypothetical protein
MMILTYTLVALGAFSILMMFKVNNASKQQEKILLAIDKWVRFTEDYETAMKYLDSVEDFDKTTFRLWDWGCTRIVPKDVYEEIKPYI